MRTVPASTSPRATAWTTASWMPPKRQAQVASRGRCRARASSPQAISKPPREVGSTAIRERPRRSSRVWMSERSARVKMTPPKTLALALPDPVAQGRDTRDPMADLQVDVDARVGQDEVDPAAGHRRVDVREVQGLDAEAMIRQRRAEVIGGGGPGPLGGRVAAVAQDPDADLRRQILGTILTLGQGGRRRQGHRQGQQACRSGAQRRASASGTLVAGAEIQGRSGVPDDRGRER